MPYDRVTSAAIDLLVGGDYGSRGRLERVIEAKHPGAITRARDRLKQKRFDAKFTGDPPAWAKRLVAKYEPGLSQLAWHRSNVGSFHGTCSNGNHISVTVPREREDNDPDLKVLVLHELAHAEAVYDGHGDGFYDVWYRYLTAEGLYRAALATKWRGMAGLKRAAKRARAKAATAPVARPDPETLGVPQALRDLLKL